MKEILKTDQYNKWFIHLKDNKAQAQIERRIDRLQLGNYGDSKSLGGGLFELRIDIGQGYRVYFFEKGNEIVILSYGGNKSTQERDIKKARDIMEEIKNGQVIKI